MKQLNTIMNFFKDPPYEVISNSFISFEEIYKLKKVEDLIDKVYNRQYLYFTLRYIFQIVSPSEFFEKLSSKVNSNLNTREFIKELYRIIKDNFVLDTSILNSLFRFDILRRFPEEFLPEELAMTKEEKERIKQAIYQAKEYQDIGEPKEIIRSSRACIFEFDIERFVEDNSIEKGNFLYIFFGEKIKKIKLQ